MSVLCFDCRFRYPGWLWPQFCLRGRQRRDGAVGPSGSGRATVLNLVAGLLKPDAGAIALEDQILFDSQATVNVPPDKRGVGYGFKIFNCSASECRENCFGPKARHASRREVREDCRDSRAGDVLNRFRLD